MQVDVRIETDISRSVRVRQLEAMFDVPASEKCSLSWKADLPIEAQDWNVGLIVGPSGAGKTTVAKRLFGESPTLSWSGKAVVDDFREDLSMEAISGVCQAVGFNTIPAWMRPYHVLSNGERFRVDLARRLLELPDPIMVDEFTSVVDRQVAQIGSHAVQKFVRKHGRKFVGVSCHYDIVDWLQPDWVFEPATCTFTRRLLQRRPALPVAVSRAPYAAWDLFAPFHYLTANLHRAARCFVLYVGDRPAAFAGMLHRPNAHVRDIIGCSRLVTLPDWQGLGLAMVLIEKLGAAYKSIGKRVHTYPAHPALIRSFGKSPVWKMTGKPGAFAHGGFARKLNQERSMKGRGVWGHATSSRAPSDCVTERSIQGARPCAVFEYSGPSLDDVATARQFLGVG